MVHLLEERLGVALFERKANRLALTPTGHTYQAGLTQIFDSLAALTQQVTAMGNARVLTFGVGPTFAIRWLIPRLADFQKRAPDIDVRFATGLLTASGLIDNMIPPAIAMILYAAVAEQSLVRIFTAGFVPGFLFALAFVAYILVKSWRSSTEAP